MTQYSEMNALTLWLLTLAVLVVHGLWISWNDQVHMIIPDMANLSLGAAGFLWSSMMGHPVGWGIVEIAGGGGLFWVMTKLYLHLRGVHGLGLGDVKFIAAATAWTGLIGLPWLVLIASWSALTLVMAKHMFGHTHVQGQRIAFGPHLSFGLLATWLAKSSGMI